MNVLRRDTGRCRELFEKAAREGIELPDVARGYLMLRGARLGPERKAIVLAAAGQSYTERNVAQALRSTFPVNLGVTKKFVHVMDDCDEPLMPLEEQSTSEVDSGEIDALITNFETLSNTSEESCPIDEEEAVRTLVIWKESRPASASRACCCLSLSPSASAWLLPRTLLPEARSGSGLWAATPSLHCRSHCGTPRGVPPPSSCSRGRCADRH